MARLPTLGHPSRRRPLVGLLAAGLMRGALAGTMVVVLLRLPLAQGGWSLAAVLVTLAAALAGLRALETVLAEQLGQRYVHSLRQRVLATVCTQHEAVARRFGRGSLWLRMSGDLNGLRRWISQGLARAVAAAAMLGSLLLALAVLAPTLAIAAAAVTALPAVVAALSQPPLRAREQVLRRHRARLANAVAHGLEAAAGAESPHTDAAQRRVRRRSSEVRDASVARAQIHARVRATAEFAPLAGLALVLVLPGGASHGAQLGALALFGLIAQPLRELTLAWEMRQSFHVARDKLLRMLQLDTPYNPLRY